jgi:DEAD/DEAH box helicase domain-containing protein
VTCCGAGDIHEAEPDYYTQSMVQASVSPTFECEAHVAESLRISLCAIDTAMTVTGYRRISFEGDEAIGLDALSTPTLQFSTFAARFDLEWMEGQLDTDLSPIIHAVEHALLAVAPFVAGCEPRDLGSAWYAAYFGTLSPCIFIFDRVPGGVGLAERLYQDRRAWVEAALTLLETCPCIAGCPACLLSPRCTYGNQMLDKAGATELLDRMLDRLAFPTE